MRSSNESYLLSLIKLAARGFMLLPFQVALLIARIFGRMAYFILSKKRRVIYANLKTVFCERKDPKELRRITKMVFINLTQSVVELLYLPKMKRMGFQNFVKVEGFEFVDKALEKGNGVIYLAVHSGNWELASVVGSEKCPYNIVANIQEKAPQLNELLNDYRRIAGAKVIAPGSATRDIIRALKKNEAVTLVLDQGGRDGTVVKFLGKTASMSTGAIRLGLKYDIPICAALMSRVGPGRHQLKFVPALDMSTIDENEINVVKATRQASKHFEELIDAHPEEYMWFYKIFKYTNEPHVLILDDGRTGHLRQSQATAQILKVALAARGKTVVERTVSVHFKTRLLLRTYSLYAFFAQFLPFLRREDIFKRFLSKESYDTLMSFKADFIISCGSSVGGVNFLLSHCHLAKSICLLKAGLVSWNKFDLAIIPSHDEAPKFLKTKLAVTKAALNLITPEYLKEQGGLLLNRYAHLKNNARTKIGVLLGGDTKGVVFDEGQIRSFLRQLKDAAQHFNADILITTSRRTSTVIDSLVQRELKGFDRCALCIIANENNIPEAVGGIASLSDLLIVSGESISMVSEAVCSGKRTIVFSPVGTYAANPSSKYDRFVLSLSEQGFLIATSIKDLSVNITDILRNKIILKNLDDRAIVRKAIEGII